MKRWTFLRNLFDKKRADAIVEEQKTRDESGTRQSGDLRRRSERRGELMPGAVRSVWELLAIGRRETESTSAGRALRPLLPTTRIGVTVHLPDAPRPANAAEMSPLKGVAGKASERKVDMDLQMTTGKSINPQCSNQSICSQSIVVRIRSLASCCG